MELIHGGHLGTFIVQSKKQGKIISERVAKSIVRQVLAALLYLHNERIVHRDIKPENRLLDIDGHIRIGIFNFMKRITCLIINIR